MLIHEKMCWDIAVLLLSNPLHPCDIFTHLTWTGLQFSAHTVRCYVNQHNGASLLTSQNLQTHSFIPVAVAPMHSTVSYTSFVFVCHSTKHRTTQRPQSHFLRKYTVFFDFWFNWHTRHRRSLPFSGQWLECFTSRRLVWFFKTTWPPPSCAMYLCIFFLWTSDKLSH